MTEVKAAVGSKVKAVIGSKDKSCLKSCHSYHLKTTEANLMKLHRYRIITGWEHTGQMLCIVDTSLSVLMTLRMCLRELCCVFTVWIKTTW